MTLITPRPISSAELAVLETALRRACKPDATRVTAEELKRLVVYRTCDCGCASVGFLPEGVHPNQTTMLLADGLGLSADNKQVGVIVYGSSGQLVELEVYWHHDGAAPLPRADTIVPWERGVELPETEL